MADAKPVDVSGAKQDDSKKRAESKGVKKIKSWNEMIDAKTGKKMIGKFEMPDGTVVTNH